MQLNVQPAQAAACLSTRGQKDKQTTYDMSQHGSVTTLSIHTSKFTLDARSVVSSICRLLGWWHGVTVSNVGRINEVNQRRARLVLGWVTIFGWVNGLGT